VVFSDSTKCLESTKIESPADLPLNLDGDAPWTIEQKWDLWEWIVKNLDDAIDRAENRNLTLRKFIRFCSYEDNPNIGISDKDQELLEKIKNTRLYGEGENKLSNSTSKSKQVFYEQ
jgi:hypothetical protein